MRLQHPFSVDRCRSFPNQFPFKFELFLSIGIFYFLFKQIDNSLDELLIIGEISGQDKVESVIHNKYALLVNFRTINNFPDGL